MRSAMCVPFGDGYGRVPHHGRRRDRYTGRSTASASHPGSLDAMAQPAAASWRAAKTKEKVASTGGSFLWLALIEDSVVT